MNVLPFLLTEGLRNVNDVDRVRAQEPGVALLCGFTVLLASVVIGVLTVP